MNNMNQFIVDPVVHQEVKCSNIADADFRFCKLMPYWLNGTVLEDFWFIVAFNEACFEAAVGRCLSEEEEEITSFRVVGFGCHRLVGFGFFLRIVAVPCTKTLYRCCCSLYKNCV